MTRQLALMGALALLLLVGTGGAFAQPGTTPAWGYQLDQAPGPFGAATTGCTGNTRNGICGLVPGADLAVTCPTLLQIQGQLPTELRLACLAVTATPGATQTATVLATAVPSNTVIPPSTAVATLPPSLTAVATAAATAIPTATGTLAPTLLPTAAVPPTPGGAMIEGVAVCTDHEPTRWHPLVKRDSAGTLLCTYGHEHHGNPHDVDDLFGLPGAWYGGVQEVSYPWQTFSFTSTGALLESPAPPTDPSVYENARKHNGYKWYVKRDLPCQFLFGSDLCFRAFRVQTHSMGAQTDTVVRFHSFSMEALVQSADGRQGIVRGGGWMNTGHLGLLVDGGVGVACPPLDTNPPANTYTCPRNNTSGNFRESGSMADVPAPHTGHANPGAPTNWYADHGGGTSPGPSVQMWGPTSYANPAQQLFYPPQWRANNTVGHLENLFAGVAPLSAANQSPDGTYTGRLAEDRHGTVVPDCGPASLDCIPFVVEHVPGNGARWHAPTLRVLMGDDATYFPSYNVDSPVTGNSLVTFPN